VVYLLVFTRLTKWISNGIEPLAQGLSIIALDSTLATTIPALLIKMGARFSIYV